jgi:hypothetical protein
VCSVGVCVFFFLIYFFMSVQLLFGTVFKVIKEDRAVQQYKFLGTFSKA